MRTTRIFYNKCTVNNAFVCKNINKSCLKVCNVPFEFHDFISKMDKERRESVKSSSFDRSERKKLMKICQRFSLRARGRERNRFCSVFQFYNQIFDPTPQSVLTKKKKGVFLASYVGCEVTYLFLRAFQCSNMVKWCN